MANDMRAQFERAYIEYSEPLFRHCYFRLHSRERAKEIMQDVFMKAWDYSVKGNQIDNMRAFLYKIANNLVMNEWRKKPQSSLEELEETVGFQPVADSEDREVIESRIDAELLMKKLKNLEPKYRDAVTMRYIDELPVREIAEMLGESESNVSVRIHRGIKMLKDIYET